MLTNESMPGLVKVGLTSSLPEDRAQDLYTTSVAKAFNVASARLRHGPAPSNVGHTIFSTSIEPIRSASFSASVWGRLSKRCGARSSTQVVWIEGFAQMSAGRAEVLDLWQAHVELLYAGDSPEEPNDHATARHLESVAFAPPPRG